jgi:two-component system phosphate regulon sensor histidine kinase PhoR
MPNEWLAELRRLLLGVVVLAGIGVLLGDLAIVLLIGVSAYLAWHLHQLYSFRSWLASDSKQLPPVNAGVWAPVARELQRLNRQNRKRKKRLRRLATRLRQLAQASPDGAIILDARGELQWFNEAASTTLGLDDQRDIGQPIANLVRSPAFTEYLAGGDFEQPLEFASPVDETIHLSLRAVPYGRNRRLLLVRDITRLQRLEQVRKDFVANVSHEMRSPLTVVMGYLETMADDEQTPKHWHHPIKQMGEQAGRMYTIVEDLLHLSSLEHDPGGAGRHAVPVAEILESIAADAEQFGGSARSIDLNVDEQLLVFGEYNELYSAFSNLIFNAAHYTPEDGDIFVEWCATENGARLDVRDTGIGIESHHIPRLTERFYRVDKARSRQLGGTGLGLAIVKHVLMRHDSRLEIESELGEGSRFTCNFPLSRVERTSRKLAAHR